MYVNGVESTSVTNSTVPSGNTVPETGAFLRLGARATGGSNALDGQMDVMTAWSKELSPEEVMQHYAATRARFQGGTGFQLLDRVGTSVAAATLTLNGLASDYDAIYLVVGKIVDISTSGRFEIRPVPGFSPLVSIQSSLNVGPVSTPNILTSTTGWLVAGPDTDNDYVSFFEAWIWPGMGRFGGTSANAQARMFRSIGSALQGASNNVQEGFGSWANTNADSPFESITIDGVAGATMEAGSEISVYKLGYGEDPV
jgi:hypothetical protein